jgi:hypothetical protein
VAASVLAHLSSSSVPGQKFCTIVVKIRKSLWGQGFGLAAGLLPGVGMVQYF